MTAPRSPALTALRYSACRTLGHICVYALPALRATGRAADRQHAVDLQRLTDELEAALERHRREG